MGCRIIVGVKDLDTECAVFYDSVTDTAFGPVMDSEEEALDFMVWLAADQKRWGELKLAEKTILDSDPRCYTVKALEDLYAAFRREKEKV